MDIEKITGSLSGEEFDSAAIDALLLAPREHEIEIGNETVKSPVSKDVLIAVRQRIGELTEHWLSFYQIIDLVRLIKK